jgi:hypothetical protein
MYKNKSIDKVTKANTKSRNKKEKEQDSRWWKRNGGGEEQLEREERRGMIETDAAKGKAALGNGRKSKRKRENVVLKRTVGYSPLMGRRRLLSLRRRKRGFHDPLRVRPSSLFVLFARSSNSIAFLRSWSV